MEYQVNSLQEEVFLTKDRQDKALGKLDELTKEQSVAAQQGLKDKAQSLPAINPEKKKAEDLRKKVEVILDSGM